MVVTPLDGQPDPTRSGGPWHLEPGAYAAIVTAGEPGDHGSFGLDSVEPTEIGGPGDVELTASAAGPGLAVFELRGEHSIAVGPGGVEPGWSLTWSADAPPEGCSSALSCMSVRAPSLPHDAALGPRISGRGYLALTSTDGEAHTVTVRIGDH